MPEPWPPGAATGVGSLPGTDLRSALAAVLDELPALPYLPELPARGPEATLVGRGVAHLVDLHADIQPSGWRLVARPGREERRARDLLAGDLDAVEEAAGGLAALLKLQVAGPWTLAAALELPRGGQVLADPGAVRDLADSLAAGVVELLGAARRRLPAARFAVQLDEPTLPAVLAGAVRTASGFATLRAVAAPDAVAILQRALTAAREAGALTVLHCCHPAPPVGVLTAAVPDALSLDLTRSRYDEDVLGEFLDRGGRLVAGVVPALDADPAPGEREVGDPARLLWRRLGFEPERLSAQVSLSPTCGLAGASPEWARRATRLAASAARALAEQPVPAGGAA